MGQQQLLLIVLGVIIVGIAVVVGINVFNASSVQANKDGVTSDLTNLASMAQQYAKKAEALGGGGRDFNSWSIPSGLQTTPNGDYTVGTTDGTIGSSTSISTDATTIYIYGNGNEQNVKFQVKVPVDSTFTVSDISS